MQNSLSLRFGFHPDLTRRMTLHQQLAAMMYCLHTWTATVVNFATLLMTTVCLLSNCNLIPASSPVQLRQIYLLKLAVVTFELVYGYQISLPTGWLLCLRIAEATTWIAPYTAFNMIRELLPLRFGGHRLGFTPSGSVGKQCPLDERNVAVRPPFIVRARAMLMDHGVWFHTLLLILCAMAITFSLNNARSASTNRRDFWLTLFTTTLCPALPYPRYAALLVPLTYTVWPPTVPRRRALMMQDVKTGAWRAKKSCRGEHFNGWSWLIAVPVVLQYMLTVVAYLVVSRCT